MEFERLKRTLDAFKVNISQIYLWTDSSIVLVWIKKPLAQLKTFVSRVSIIQELTESDFWKHVNSENNPADILSRGISPDKIQHCELWWFGPPFLHQYKELEPYNITAVEGDDLFLQELKETSDFPLCALLKNFEPLDIISNCSSSTKLQRVIAWCKRFIENARHPMCRTMGPLKSKELSESLKCIIKNIQRTSFYNEIQYLEKGIPLPNSCKLLNLNPFLDDSGLLRVGGRLRNSRIPRNKKHPMIIPTNHNFTYIIINHFHILYFHTGAEATLANIKNSFWIPSARNVVRKILRTCITCRKVSAKGSQQLMADLPAARVTACRVFSQAIHLEIVSDLTTEAFLAALKRFVARRGRPIEIHSDNGRNFVGANNELRKILKALFKGKMEEIMDFLSKEQIKWNFNPPSAPHFGGLWEVEVKSLKYHLKRVIGNSILSHEEFLTLVVQIEAVLNPRPICPLSNDLNDAETLTPAHFLVGSSLVAVPDPDYTEIPMNRLSRWQLVQRMNQHFWRKWSSEYLNRLQQRPKWCKGNVGFKEGDLVLVKPSENSDSLKWHLARILKLHPSKDNIVRVVTLKGRARATIDLLKDTFVDRLISRFGPVNWPPRSCGLTPLDYFLWGYVKPLVYADKPQMLDHLEDNIRHVIADIQPQMLEKVIENWTSRLSYIRASRGSPMPEIIFKM
ncbi:integrase catalytic domain-containing protein [Trichonephila clavipes]|nr:integrase catalytic domain-containing protein [Trichonephila clavipes]